MLVLQTLGGTQRGSRSRECCKREVTQPEAAGEKQGHVANLLSPGNVSDTLEFYLKAAQTQSLLYTFGLFEDNATLPLPSSKVDLPNLSWSRLQTLSLTILTFPSSTAGM